MGLYTVEVVVLGTRWVFVTTVVNETVEVEWYLLELDRCVTLLLEGNADEVVATGGG
jgi:hypothetical protein